MPVKRINREAFLYNPVRKKMVMTPKTRHATDASARRQTSIKSPLEATEIQGDVQSIVKLKADVSALEGTQIYYPVSETEREAFRTKAGKRVTPHQWAVYDFARTIPFGKITTYKDVSLAVGGSPRSVGNALRNNPFCPYVPCHRVIASNLFIGGFFGEWGADDKTGTRFHQKMDILAQEGLSFNQKGILRDAESVLWRG